jgi:hypothetical protein
MCNESVAMHLERVEGCRPMAGDPILARIFGHSINVMVTAHRMSYRITRYKETKDEQHE